MPSIQILRNLVPIIYPSFWQEEGCIYAKDLDSFNSMLPGLYNEKQVDH
jgi:hypothetical protein